MRLDSEIKSKTATHHYTWYGDCAFLSIWFCRVETMRQARRLTHSCTRPDQSAVRSTGPPLYVQSGPTIRDISATDIGTVCVSDGRIGIVRVADSGIGIVCVADSGIGIVRVG